MGSAKRLLLAAVLVATAALGCSDDDTPTAASPGSAGPSSTALSTSTTTAPPCGEDIQEALDPSSFVHALPGSEATYQTNPPTSGAHTPAPAQSGVLDLELPRGVQVGHLEAGGVLIQHEDLSAAELAALGELSTQAQVAVAPNATLPAPIVATAWLHKLSCQRVDAAALQAFIDAHVGQGPGH